MPFAPKLVDALDSAEVQAKIFNAIVKPVFDEAMAAFGKASGEKVGEMLGEFKLDYERKLELIKEEFEKDIQKVTNDRHGRITENQCETTARRSAPTEDRIGSSHTRRRNQQRRVKGKSTCYNREAILLLRQTDVSDVSCTVPSVSLHQRICNLETVVSGYAEVGAGGCGDDIQWGPFQSAVSADVLARQCTATRTIQRAWRNVRKVDKLEAASATVSRCAEVDPLHSLLEESAHKHALERRENEQGANEELFASLLATIKDDRFQHALRDVLLGAGNLHHCLPLERQVALRKRIDASVKLTLDTDSRRYDAGTLTSQSHAFFNIAIQLPEQSSDELGNKLRASYKVREGRSVHPIDTKDAKEIDDLLERYGLTDHRDAAGLFYMAVGALQEDESQ